MSTISLIAIETALFLSAMAFAVWASHATHQAAMEIYSGTRNGVRLSRRTRRLILIYVYGGRLTIGVAVISFVGLALIQIGGSAGPPEAVTLAYLLALVLLLTTVYLAIGGLMTIFSLNHMIGRGLRGEKAS